MLLRSLVQGVFHEEVGPLGVLGVRRDVLEVGPLGVLEVRLGDLVGVPLVFVLGGLEVRICLGVLGVLCLEVLFLGGLEVPFRVV